MLIEINISAFQQHFLQKGFGQNMTNYNTLVKDAFYLFPGYHKMFPLDKKLA